VRLSPQAARALELVRAGRITYGDPYPDMTRRTHRRFAGTTWRDMLGRERPRPTSVRAYADFRWLVDGSEVYGQQQRTLTMLEERGLIEVHRGDVPAYDTGVCRVTEAGAPATGEPTRTSPPPGRSGRGDRGVGQRSTGIGRQ
jgi:hypothetical protein